MNEEQEEASEEQYTKLVFACSVCKSVFKEPGICNKCSMVLKPKAA